MKIFDAFLGTIFLLSAASNLSRGAEAPVTPSQSQDEVRRLASFGTLEILPLVRDPAVDQMPTAAEATELETAITTYWSGTDKEDFESLKNFLQEHPDSPYRVAVLANLGSQAYHYGYYSQSLDFYEKAWAVVKTLKLPDSPEQQKLLSGTGIRLAELYARLGRHAQLNELISALKPYPKWGTDSNRYEFAAQGAAMMSLKPERAFNCGPFALMNIATSRSEPRVNMVKLIEAKAKPDEGFSVQDLEKLASDTGLNLIGVRRTNDEAELIMPCVAHWKAGHYAAILEKKDGRYHVKDPTFGTDFWISAKALKDESSGIFLVPGTASVQLPEGWLPLGTEASRIYGRGQSSGISDKNQCEKGKCSIGMAGVSFSMLEAKAFVVDMPLIYSPPQGPSIEFQISYNESQILDAPPGGAIGSNLSTWTMSFFAAIQDSNNGETVAAFTADGRIETFDPDNTTLSIVSGTAMERVISGNATIGFKQHFPDGSEMAYMRKQSGASSTPYYFLTAIKDPHGNTVTLTYDGSDRLTYVTDAIGQNTTITYNGTHTTWVETITDPFSRNTTLTYDGLGRLQSITDPVGIVSSFSYDASSGNVTTVTTPYGNTTIQRNMETNGAYFNRTLLVTDPAGGRERICFELSSSYVPSTAYVVPADFISADGMIAAEGELNSGVSVYLGKKAMSGLASANVTSDVWLGNTDGATGLHYWELGTQYRWMIDIEDGYKSVGIPTNTKQPLEGTTWYFYPGQWGSQAYSGNFAMPSDVVRIVEDENGDPVDQVYSYTYNSLGKVLTATDPLGRVTTYTYAGNNIDLSSVQQGGDTVATFSSYTAGHQPQVITDASGSETQMDYNGAGQLTEVRRYDGSSTLVAKTHYNYNGSGYLGNVTQMTTGGSMVVTQSMGYTNGLVSSMSDTTGYTVTYTHDNLQRTTSATYPGNITESWNYHATINGNGGVLGLSLGSHTDRLGHTTTYTYDGAGHMLTSTDGANRATTYDWCGCGALEGITDADGRSTTFVYDVQSRLIAKIISGDVYSYTYQPYSGRLATMTMPNDQGGGATMAYAYALDNQVKSISYGGAHAPDAISYSFDSTYPRLTSVTDGLGTSAYTYWAVGQSGAGQLKEINGPWGNDTLHYDYDALGQVSGRKVQSDDGSVTLQSETYVLDPLSRPTTIGGSLGNFTLSYNGAAQLTKVAYPNGMNATLGYLPAASGGWLANITNNVTVANVTTLYSEHDYTQRNDGSIETWGQKFGWLPAVAANVSGNATVQRQLSTFTYDDSGWLTGAKLGAANVTTNTTLKDIYENRQYEYDDSGNPTSSTVNLTGWSGNYNGANALTAQARMGPVRVAGYTNGPANVTVNGQTTRQWSLPGGMNWAFESLPDLTPNSSNVSIMAMAANGNSTTQVWSMDGGSTATRFTYDANGSMLTRVQNADTGSNHTITYGWSSIGQLKTVQDGNTTVTFGYDGFGRRVSLSANISGNVTTEYYLWDGNEIIQKRVGGTESGNITMRYFGAGFQTMNTTTGNVSGNYFYTKDHLGSIREVITTSGNTNTLVGRYSYGPRGETVYMDYSGGAVAQPEFGYARYFRTKYAPDLYLTKARPYDPGLGRWLSRDPIGERGGINQYQYASNGPTNYTDPLGTSPFTATFPLILDNPITIGVAGAVVIVGGSFWVAIKTGEKIGDTIAENTDTATPPPPGDCTEELYALLREAVNTSKTGVSRVGGRCEATDSLNTLTRKKAAWLAMTVARSRINQLCFRGGDWGHQTALANAYQNIARCDCLIKAKEGGL